LEPRGLEEAEVVSIEEDVHPRPIELAMAAGATTLGRTQNFYRDAVFAPAEIPRFLVDIDRMLPDVADDAELVGLLASLRALASDAPAPGPGLVAIAD
jgi:hypothetical protein